MHLSKEEFASRYLGALPFSVK